MRVFIASQLYFNRRALQTSHWAKVHLAVFLRTDKLEDKSLKQIFFHLILTRVLFYTKIIFVKFNVFKSGITLWIFSMNSKSRENKMKSQCSLHIMQWCDVGKQHSTNDRNALTEEVRIAIGGEDASGL